jgi:hypothetical protein
MSEQQIDLVEKPPVSIVKRLLVGCGIFVVLLVALCIGQYYLVGSQARSRLALALAELDETDPGWRMEEIENARLGPPDSENSALVVLAARKLVPRGLPDNKLMERFDKLPPPPELLDPEGAKVLDSQMTPLAAALAEARKLADMPDGRYTLVHAANPILTLLPHVQDAREISRLLHYDALNLAQENKGRESLRSCQAALNAGRSFDDEPVIISQLVRVACVAMAMGAMERTLAQTEPPVQELARMQSLLEKEDAHPTALVAMRGERAMQHILMAGLSDGIISAREILDGTGHGLDWGEMLVFWNAKGLARREHHKLLELMGKAVDITRLPDHEQPAAEAALDREIREAAAHSYLIRMLVPATQKFNEAARRKRSKVRCLLTALAVERYRRERGGWPAKLAELTPKLLEKVPLDPYDGKSLRYARVADGVIVYSIGPDGTDNGGLIDRTNPMRFGTDLGYQLWDTKARRQPGKPPAPPPPLHPPPGEK